MSWISTLTPLHWALFSLIPIGIILLYFLKLRREPVEVPSTFLWKKTIEDLHVNSLLQRLRRSILLFLQLLIVALAALAMLRPGLRGETSSQGRLVFLIDTSASMQTTDVDDDANRFERAKRLVSERIEAMSDSETAMLVSFSDRAEVLQSFTSDRNRLRDALSRAEVTNRPTDVLGALKAADGLANPRRTSQAGDVNDVQVADALPADLLLYSDGGFQTVTEFDLGNLAPTYIPIGTDNVTNLAITAFSAERNVEKPEQVQIFATVVNLGTEQASATATLTLDDELLDASSVDLPVGEQAGLSFSIESEEAISLKLALDINDDLAVDNVAYAALTPMRNVSVLVITPGNSPLEIALSTSKAGKICQSEFVPPEYMATESYEQRAESGNDDLIIYDRCSPETMPRTNTFFIGALPSNQVANTDGTTSEAWKWGSEMSSVALIDMDRTHPLMRYLELFSLLIFQGRSVEGPAGSTELLGADIGPMLTIAPRDGYQDLVLGFELISSDADGATQTNTNWYAERSWPVFILNVLRYLAGAAEVSGAPSYTPGDTVRLRVESAISNVDVQRLGDKPTSIPVGPSGVTEIVETDSPGNYRVKSDERIVDMFSINLFNRSESTITAAESIELGYESVEGKVGGVEKRREYWRWLLVGALAILATEWWVFGRRVG
ncbi:membrane protein containing von Willebrand factor, type A domain protein [Rhodopirellula maiorica SM1]|uniref:Integrator complex subunit 14 n=1 Tax=Rhodopirellula maiorica SM1 TaxID=1265738 RepID=M5RDM2_9BACT|nr:BatA and WFA domain-containing protein [Rhodopirellula maiorica]EMI17578.1 membrane protein containing von Willebrand factor, type A domain protein [Rhodopirellula maiorica SM1]